MDDCALALREVSKSFGKVQAVSGLSVEVPAGCIYGVLGPNGAGKTTTLRMIMDIIRPDSGRIEVLGGQAMRRAKDRVGYMPEERGLYPGMKVRPMLEYLARLKGLGAQGARAATSEWIEAVDLGGWAGHRIHDLSHGMQQRLQFAAAVLHDPDLVILDEPFSGLDPVNLEAVKEHIRRLDARGKTVVLSTHMMEQAEDLCERVLVINDGRAVLEGRVRDLRATEGVTAVAVELEGDTAFVAQLPMVASVAESTRGLDITLREGADDQALLRALMEKARVRAFRVKGTSLREVFVHAVQH